MSIYMTGFADEAAIDIDGQISATLELGWKNIESRAIDGINIHDLDDAAFEVVESKLKDANVCINCFGTTIANWGKQIDAPFESSLEEIKRAIPRMQRLGTKLVRVMSFAVLKGHGPDDQMKEERFERMREIVRLFGVEGITPVHENCMNFGGMSAGHTLELIENVPGLKLVFDTGNPVFTADRSKPEPCPRQSSWEFFHQVKDHIEYIHIKDGIWDAETETCNYTYPGEGEGDVIRITQDLIKSGYSGGISIEPHLGAVFHDSSITSDKKMMYAMYVEYGKRMESIIRTAGGTIS